MIIDQSSPSPTAFPDGLLAWAGHHSGGVKRLFDANSGRPGKELLRTCLISKLEHWVKQLAKGESGTPRILLLVGGPGNGKTEAIEHTIRSLDDKMACDGWLVEELSRSFRPPSGQAVPRLIAVDLASYASPSGDLKLSIVQDASATAGHEGQSAPQLLIQELLSTLEGPPTAHYLCCVNRGVLDDALIYALDNNLAGARALLEAITRSVSLSSNAPTCWPLAGFPAIAVWPMDAESLLTRPSDDVVSPATTLLNHATNPEYWPQPNACVAGKNCPFCGSQARLIKGNNRANLLQVLRWYELASGKRWSFRDLFTLLSYLLAGHRQGKIGQHASPCDWAKNQFDLDVAGQLMPKPKREHLTAIFELATSSYQHALFHSWAKGAVDTLKRAIKDLGLDSAASETRTLLGLQHFIQQRNGPHLPATIESLLKNLSDLLDPSLASPDTGFSLDGRKQITLADVDIRFSRSIDGGLDFIKKSPALSPSELELLHRLGKVDALLSSSTLRRKNAAAAGRLQRLVRDFACRLVRRSMGAMSAVVADAQALQAFQGLVDHDEREEHLFDVAKQVRNLLNTGEGFEVSLTTTFGQPLPPKQRQAILIAQPRSVRPLALQTEGRPRSPICFLSVGDGKSKQSIALTYDLFKAVQELDRGLSPASLPPGVIALIDTTRAMLSGPIVRDTDVLIDARIRIGIDGTEIGSSWNKFKAIGKKGNA